MAVAVEGVLMVLRGGRGWPGVETLLLWPGERDGRRGGAAQHGGGRMRPLPVQGARRASAVGAAARRVLALSHAVPAGRRVPSRRACTGKQGRAEPGRAQSVGRLLAGRATRRGGEVQATLAGLSLRKRALCSCQRVGRRRLGRRGFHSLLRKVITQAGLCVARPVDE